MTSRRIAKKQSKKDSQRRTIVDAIDELPTPVIDASADLKRLYYEAKAKKIGF